MPSKSESQTTKPLSGSVHVSGLSEAYGKLTVLADVDLEMA